MSSEPNQHLSANVRFAIALIAFFVIAIYFLWEEHEAHILEYLPLLLVLVVCGGMHLFMHGGHSSHKNRNDSNDDSEER